MSRIFVPFDMSIDLPSYERTACLDYYWWMDCQSLLVSRILGLVEVGDGLFDADNRNRTASLWCDSLLYGVLCVVRFMRSLTFSKQGAIQ